MPSKIAKCIDLRREKGLSLIELMIAMGIGVVLLLGLVQVFGASRAAFNTAEGLSRVQESGRFASDLLRRELRMAGHLGCLNETGYTAAADPQLFNHLVAPSTNLGGAPFAFRIDIPVQGWEAQFSGPNQTIPLVGAPAGWNPAMPAAMDAVQAEAVGGSDVLVIRYLSAESIGLIGLGVNADQINIRPADSIFVSRGLIYGVLNCRSLSLFQALSSPDATGLFDVGVGGLNQSGWLGNEGPYGIHLSRVHRYNMAIYYVGNDVGGSRSLFRRVVNPALAAPYIGARESLIEGVESMQVVYGVDTSTPLDDQPDAYLTAAGVAALDPDQRLAWRRVVNIRVGLLTASARPASDASAAGITHRVADTIITPPADGRVRQVYETLITVRNRVR